MRRASLTCFAAAIVALASDPAASQVPPPSEPILRIETGVHGAGIVRFGVDVGCHTMVTASLDKTARVWALPRDGIGEAKLQRILRPPIGPGGDGRLAAATLSPDGRLAAVGGWGVSSESAGNAVYVFDADSGQLLRRLGNVVGVVAHLVFSSDGRYLAATLTDKGGLMVWETRDWTLVAEDRDYSGGSRGGAFDASGKLYTTAFDGYLRRYGSDFKLEMKSKTLGREPYGIAVNPKGDAIAVGFNDRSAVDIYDAKDLKHLFAPETAPLNLHSRFYGIAWSTDGARLCAGLAVHSQFGTFPVRIWDQGGRGIGHDAGVARNSIMQLLPCGDAIALVTQDPAFGVISASGEKQVWLEGVAADMRGKLGEDFTVSEDGSKVRFGLGAGGYKPVLFDLRASRLTKHSQPVAGLAAADTTSLRIEHWQSETAPTLDGQAIELEHNEISRALAIAAGHDRFVLGTEAALRAYDRGGWELWKKRNVGAWGVNIPRGGKFVVAAYVDGTIRWHRLSDGEEILALFVNAKTLEWVLLTPQGYYASSANGDQMVGWHLNRGWDQAGEFVSAAQLKTRLYRPDIVMRAFELADADVAVREARSSKDFTLSELVTHTPPEFHIVDPRDNTHAESNPLAVKLALAETNDPVTGFDIKVNGREVTPRDVRAIDQPRKNAQTRALSIPLEKGENRIQIAARNSVGETVQDLIAYLDREGVLDKKGRLFILAIGVDKYAKLGSRYTLHYAGADARLMVETLTHRAGPLHTQVISKLLVSDGDIPPTKANIEDALLAFRDARPEDTVVLFLASHGVNEGPDYLMIPEDAQLTGAGYWRPSSVVKWSVLQQALQEAQGSRIMFVDTCHASGAYNARLVKDAADANIVVFSATDKDTEAQETPTLGHGVFTYALSQGLNGRADSRKQGLVNILALADYVSEEVRRMTHAEQEPVFSASGVKNFVVATP
jgi:WD40 repeat protein